MLTFHSAELLEICKQLILQIYSYLKDSHAKDFHHESMLGALWEYIGDLSMTAPSSGGGRGAGAGNETQCRWCNKNKDLHKLLNLAGQKNRCPLNNLTRKSKAQEGAKWVIDQR
jgi:hypothetical protein